MRARPRGVAETLETTPQPVESGQDVGVVVLWKGPPRLETNTTTELVEIDGLMSLKSLAEYLDCGSTFAGDLIASGAIPSFKVGSLRRVRKADVDEFISRCIKWKKD